MKARARIALIDDDQDFLYLNRCILEEQGFQVSCYSDPLVAIEAMNESAPDIIITDVMMSKITSGFTFLKMIRSDRKLSQIPVIIVTAIGSKMGFDFSPRDEVDLKAMGAQAYFCKPVDRAAFLSRINELLADSPQEKER